MNAKRRTQNVFPSLALIAFLVVTLACGSSSNSSTQFAPSTAQGGSETAHATDTPKAAASPIPAAIGFSRSNPYPRAELVTTPNWAVQIVEVKRGEEAWKDIQAANIFNEAAPEGMEYLLLKIHVKSNYADSEEHSISGCDFAVTGSRLIKYTCGGASVVEPDPQLDAQLFTGGESVGWAGYLIAKGEENLILMVDEVFSFDSDAIRYIAIDDGASISLPSDLAGNKSTDVGKERNSPASRTEKVITNDWEISVVEVVKGADAWKMVQEANQFNDPPAEGLEYIAVKVHVRHVGTEDKAASIDGSFFKTTGSASVLYDSPTVVDPYPQLDIWLFPGGEYEGWIVVQAAKGETTIMLVFEPLFDFSGANRRFISLEP